MATRKPFATISYNTENFLANTLNTFIDEGKLSFWYFIKHKPEEDEEKDHIHVYCEPNKPIDFCDFVKYFIEPVENNKPLRCLPCRNASTEDNILYNLHDKDYLASKFMSRKYHYELSDCITSDLDYLCELYNNIDRRKYCVNAFLTASAENGVPFFDLVAQGYIPVHQINSYKSFYDCLVASITYRNGRDNHEEFSNKLENGFQNAKKNEKKINAELEQYEKGYQAQFRWDTTDLNNLPVIPTRRKK